MRTELQAMTERAQSLYDWAEKIKNEGGDQYEYVTHIVTEIANFIIDGEDLDIAEATMKAIVEGRGMEEVYKEQVAKTAKLGS